ncbi:MAG: hypothetical protein RJB38_270 [Pseudomonadota bacterium]|jgi:hypothetical protein
MEGTRDFKSISWIMALAALFFAGVMPGNQAHSAVSVERLVLHARSQERPELQLIVTQAPTKKWNAQLWNGDYLSSACTQIGRATSILRFRCGKKKIRVNWNSADFRDQGIVRAFLIEGKNRQEELEPLTLAL